MILEYFKKKLQLALVELRLSLHHYRTIW